MDSSVLNLSKRNNFVFFWNNLYHLSQQNKVDFKTSTERLIFPYNANTHFCHLSAKRLTTTWFQNQNSRHGNLHTNSLNIRLIFRMFNWGQNDECTVNNLPYNGKWKWAKRGVRWGGGGHAHESIWMLNKDLGVWWSIARKHRAFCHIVIFWQTKAIIVYGVSFLWLYHFSLLKLVMKVSNCK